jgi:general secretion pathway protein M
MGLLDRMQPRERRLLSVVGMVVAVLMVLGLPLGLELLVRSKRAANEDMRSALAAVQEGRQRVRERATKKETVTQRYAKPVPQLASFIEQAARAHKLELSDSVDRPPVPHGKKYTERQTVVHLKKAGLLALSKFLESIEKSESPVIISRLEIRKRTDAPDSYDVELGISTFDRVADKLEAPKP